MSWNFTDDKPIYMQLMEQIQLRIICGKYKAGAKLPSVREIASKISVNPNTIQKALTELEKTGLVFSKRTSGRFITEDIEIIKHIRCNLAKDTVTSFFKNMNEIGYTQDEIVELVKNISKEMKL